ncbi:MAG: hypothetical protein UR69_C0003G0126 [Candidatus Moranbacteria bacterium GW2011_GWE2_35_2-]|nr:MAG: hypothetical protein UR69_C0003G0126 [Candidatus Moranbacteria bacterium GW2011_GWE2_35_2-]KKQ04627.1 MAG: hypothetical protein US15_C0049G0003 [Candidatus Moranbacteria bacterium GW2011_GWF1_36_4]KKQ21982.1 MAG: hypothetical protein US37_C0005G0024 [Candidatus Moranbacteria bacterium GW2011_GWF2_37_11]KKQ29103.1 MAG: hypothetical protein US44_C0003G0015 [Candidatus Moranbacteria bacterium GW2011_GWD1_37_17]KKQ31088.1 MAG: hypothetical protein US47_C0001G0321 [Candidatus Moranbacteria b
MKKYSRKFWIIFWLSSVVFLATWYVFWQTRFGGDIKQDSFSGKSSGELGALYEVANYFLKNDNQEKTFLILFQNNLELRPGGGFIGSFGIFKIKNGKLTLSQIHDTGNFDGRIPDTVEPPYPMKQTLRINSWKLRDSNFSPDFQVNAKKAEEFYYMGSGGEKFDGVIGITTNVLSSFLKATGPIQIEGYPGTYDSENAVITLERQVEKDYVEQGIEAGERKAVMSELGKEVLKRVFDSSGSQKLELFGIIADDLENKDIQMYFHDKKLQQLVWENGWAGDVDQDWNKDYLMMVDANLGAYKSDYYIKRSMDYFVDFSKQRPEATLKITYKHTALQKDWMTKDYLSYLRIYVPGGSEFISTENTDKNIQKGEEFGKQYFGAIVNVPLDSEKTAVWKYYLPENITAEDYALEIQKQSGIGNMSVKVEIIQKDGIKKNFDTIIDKDTILQ